MKIAIIGSSGAIGYALAQEYAKLYPLAVIHAFSRKKIVSDFNNITAHEIDYYSEESIKVAANVDSSFDKIIVATGILHNGTKIMPEKALRDLSFAKFEYLFRANTIVPAMLAKYFITKLAQASPAIFAVLSARVGSISDNELGGWYAYRASKAALNMIIKNLAIETKRTNKLAIIVGLHPGTVNSNLSKPFQKNVPESKLFSPQYSASCLMRVLENRQLADSGSCFDWNNKQIEP